MENPSQNPDYIGVGDRIEAKLYSGQAPGRISVDYGDGTYAVQYDDGDFEPRIRKADIFATTVPLPQPPPKPAGWTMPSNFSVGSSVQSYRRYGTRGPFSGRITGINATKDTFAIQFDDGDSEPSVPGWLLQGETLNMIGR